MAPKHSGLQREVLALYRRALRMVNTKPPTAQPKFRLFVRYSFKTQATSISPRNISTIEHLLRRGRRQIEMYEDPNVRDCWIDEPLYFVAKRYVPPNSSPTGLTLLFFHNTGSHKEVWEPIIQNIFEQASNGTHSKSVGIREAWTWDWQTHGEAGRLNAAVVARAKKHIVLAELAHSIKRFAATEGFLHGHNLAGIGHCSGGTSLVLTTIDDAQPGLKYKVMIIMEPSIVARESAIQDLHDHLKGLRAMVERRRHTWKSREAARRHFQGRPPWRKWDPRTLQLFVEHGLTERLVQNADGSSAIQVTTCCSPFQEGSAYYGAESNEDHYAAAETLKTLDPDLPVHMLFVTPPEVWPEYQREAALRLRKFASVKLIPNVGHFLVQEKPDMVASLVYDTLIDQAATQAKL
ncbi:hypothetical protein PYCCODRAFT_1463520 [Trametes coccinea BRFM310]|uniref:Uncharacterized protein n=1 Tax=Trametes coccinea (strain BRFM310) TaxID=1353009 RepID=A0A1Y2J453_TRAC3|nr:hypothetical protein PYCCODRAFT_1463520 [Trametes coccinea BRFM310]